MEEIATSLLSQMGREKALERVGWLRKQEGGLSDYQAVILTHLINTEADT